MYITAYQVADTDGRTDR